MQLKTLMKVDETTKEFSFFRTFICLFLEKGEGREKEKHRSVASFMPPTGDLAHNSGRCPDWESSRQPFFRRPELSPLSHTSQGGVFWSLSLD